MDNFFVKMFQKREVVPPVEKRDAPVPSSSDEKQPDVQGGSYEERIVYANSPVLALTVSAVYRAIELRAKTIGQMPVQYQRKDDAGGNFTPWMSGLGKRMNYLLQEQPNPLMDASSLWEQVTINRLQFGNGFVYIERDVFGDPIAFWLAICGGYDMATGTYNITYMNEDGIRNIASVPRDNVLHFPNTYRYMNGFWGVPTLRFAADTLSLIKTQKRQSLETAAKGGRMKLLISEAPSQNGGYQAISQGLYNKKEMDKYAANIQEQLTFNDVVALRGLDKTQSLSLTAGDMQMMESMSLSYDDVARFYAVPRPLLMLDTNSHYNDYSNATMEFLSRTIFPDKTDMEKEIARKLLGLRFYGTRRIHICEKPLLAMDQERQAKVDQLNLQTGAKTVNEIRAEHDMPTVADGDKVYISTNLAELGSEKLSGNQPMQPTTENDETQGNQAGSAGN